jgi:hypothetical protein
MRFLRHLLRTGHWRQGAEIHCARIGTEGFLSPHATRLACLAAALGYRRGSKGGTCSSGNRCENAIDRSEFGDQATADDASRNWGCVESENHRRATFPCQERTHSEEDHPGCDLRKDFRTRDCQAGNCGCGTCETRVMEGIPDHRDLYLSDEEKSCNKTIMICCSGSKSPVLVLDL